MGKGKKEQQLYAGNAYGKRKMKPRIRFRLIYVILIFVVCILAGLGYYMFQMNTV